MTTKEEMHREIERLAFEVTKSLSSTSHNTTNTDQTVRVDDRRARLATMDKPLKVTSLRPSTAQFQSRIMFLERRIEQLEKAFAEEHAALLQIWGEVRELRR